MPSLCIQTMYKNIRVKLNSFIFCWYNYWILWLCANVWAFALLQFILMLMRITQCGLFVLAKTLISGISSVRLNCLFPLAVSAIFALNRGFVIIRLFFFWTCNNPRNNPFSFIWITSSRNRVASQPNATQMMCDAIICMWELKSNNEIFLTKNVLCCVVFRETKQSTWECFVSMFHFHSCSYEVMQLRMGIRYINVYCIQMKGHKIDWKSTN